MTMIQTWAGFIISLTAILVVSKKSLPLGLVCGSLILGLITLPASVVLDEIIKTITDPTILIIALAMGIIPLLGGTMKRSGQIERLINNVRLPKRYLLPFSSALMGLLPMPGGALLSAPIVEKAGEGVADDLKAVINNWFRHLFILIYPLAPALIVTAKMSGLDIYVAIGYLLPTAVLAAILSYLFFLRHINGTPSFTGRFSLKTLSLPLLIITIAPILDFSLKRLFHFGVWSTLIGVSTALTLSIVLSRKSLHMPELIRRMKPWNFSFIIVGMFLYQHIFQQTNTGDAIGLIPMPILTLSVTAGFTLGVLTGRVQLPASIIIPVYLASGHTMTPVTFSLIYTAIYFGYIISPVHPCLVVTCEYFHVSIRRMMQKSAVPTMVIFAVALALSFVF